MSSLTSFPNFSDLPFKLRDLIWLFSLDELALSWKPRELGPLFYPLQQQNWQPRDATGQMSSPEEDREEAKERQLPLYHYRQRIPHFGVNGEARAAASSWASKQEAGWLAAHQGCVEPRRCATWFDGDRKALAQPRLFFRKTGGFSDGFFLSQAEYERCRDVLG
ncbi:hypothetical protein BO99DRAFT_414654 [Aspergillus violaceofuscus CBS 115571]|uniref:2EXR domain-containing protein n=1 Tax=Aspergillus violaceofuscus (strain CBS 115571) TaxID=1450538 RepID=A0A2V5H7U7_ASPV1|nr:hypothetical protein BO99DRAFT_414654 [Aspergillus violaceofuscus CBS 115571]